MTTESVTKITRTATQHLRAKDEGDCAVEILEKCEAWVGPKTFQCDVLHSLWVERFPTRTRTVALPAKIVDRHKMRRTWF